MLRALTFAPADNRVAPGTTETTTFTLVANDGTDDSTANSATTVISTSVNDAPVTDGDFTGGTVEDSGNTATGTLSISDVDAGQTPSFAATTQAGNYGSLVLDAQGNWTYTLDNSNSAVQAIVANGTLQDIVTLTATDGTQQNITITITGVNGVATISGVYAGDATEDSSTQVSGTLSITDEDTGQAAFVAQSNVTGNYGTFNVAANGAWTYDLTDSPTIQALAAGSQLTDTLLVASVDGTDTQLITITITGVNGAAVITGTATGNATEDSSSQVTGTLAITDEDTGEAVFVAQTGTTGNYGSFSVETDGDWSYSLDNTNNAVQALPQGNTLTDSFTVASVDGTQKTVTITITGVNGAAVITGTASGDATEDSSSQVTGTLAITDEDTDEAVFVAQTGTTGNYGSFSVETDGDWRYSLDNTNNTVQALPQGSTLTDSFTVASADGTQKTVTITITGVNGTAVITGTATGDATEDSSSLVTGTLAITDEDTGEAVFVAQTGTAGNYGSFSVETDGDWRYSLDNTNNAVQALPQGSTLTDSFTVASADGTQKTVTITITGVNGAAVITGTATGDATEDSSSQVTGTLAITDEDTGEAVFVAQTGTTGNYGSFSVETDGDWSYSLDNTNNAVQALPQGSTLTDTFTVVSKDGSDTQTVTITITGVNGAAVITGTASGDATEDSSSLVTGTLAITDEDTGEAVFVAQTDKAGNYGSFSVETDGDWRYSLDNTNNAVQALPQSSTLTDSFTVASVDGTQKTVTITITGVNGAAVITGTATGDATEDSSSQVTGTLAVADEDTGEAVFTVQNNVAGSFGTFNIAADGRWTYDIDNTNNQVQSLPNGSTLTDTFTVSSADGSGTQSVTITITGVNGIPTITGTATGGVTEDATVQVTGQLTINDEDTGEAQFVAQTAIAGNYGRFSVGTDGVWTYDLDNSDTVIQALPDGATLTDAFTVTSLDGTGSQTVTITITGVNGVASITGAVTGSVSEDSTGQISGSLSIADEDTDEAVFVAQSNVAGSFGTFDVDTNGQWTFVVDNSNSQVQQLREGDTLTDSFVVRSADGTSQTITITIRGTNDVAVISGQASGATNEGDSSLVTGQLFVDDSDSGQSSFASQSNVAGLYGTFSINGGGQWSYRLDNNNASVQALPNGQQLTDSFTVSSIDGTDSRVVTVTISGTNGEAVISGTATGIIDEDGTQLTGQLEITDEDSGEAAFVPQTGVAGQYGQFSLAADGAWTFVVDSDNQAVQALTEGQELTETFLVSSADGTGTQEVTVTIRGQNDAPIAGADEYNVEEGGSLSIGAANGVLGNDTDVDLTGTLTAALVESPRAAASFTFNADGSFDYTHNGSEELADRFSYQVSDGALTSEPVTVVIGIENVNDAPEFISEPPTQTVAGDTFSYAIGVRDPDSSEVSLTFTGPDWLAIIDNQLTGVVPFDAEGTVSYTLTASDGEFTATQTATLNVTGRESASVALNSQWLTSPAYLGQQVQLQVTANYLGGAPLSGGTLVMGFDKGQVSVAGCSGSTANFQCPLTLSQETPVQTFVFNLTHNQVDNVVATSRITDADDQLLAADITDISVTRQVGGEQNVTFDLANATVIATGNLDGQGNAEVVAGTTAGDDVKIIALTAASPQGELLGTIDNTGNQVDIDVMDVNHDGLLDVLISNDDSNSQIYYGQGGMAFSAGESFLAADQAMLSDLNADGFAEAIFRDGFSVRVYENVGGSYNGQVLEFINGEEIVSFAMVDNNSFAIGAGQSLNLVQFSGSALGETQVARAGKSAARQASGDSAFIQLGDALPIEGISDIDVADLDGDMQPELVVASRHNTASEAIGAINVIAVSDSGLSALTSFGDVASHSVEVADFNGDGQADLLVGNDNGVYQIYQGDGSTAGFELTDEVIVEDSTLVLSEDIDADGLSDVVVYDDDADEVGLYLSREGTLGLTANLALSGSLKAMSLTQLSVQLEVSNIGETDVAGADLYLQLPPGVALISSDVDCTEVNGQLHCQVVDIAAGGVRPATLVLDGAMSGKDIEIQLVSGVQDADESDNSLVLNTDSVSGDLDLKAEVSKRTDGTVAYQMTVSNLGAVVAREVSVELDVPVGLALGDLPTQCDAEGVCRLGDLMAGEVVSLELTLESSQTISSDLIARVNGRILDSNTDNNTAKTPLAGVFAENVTVTGKSKGSGGVFGWLALMAGAVSLGRRRLAQLTKRKSN